MNNKHAAENNIRESAKGGFVRIPEPSLERMKAKYITDDVDEHCWNRHFQPKGLLDKGGIYTVVAKETQYKNALVFLLEAPGYKFNSHHFEFDGDFHSDDSLEMPEGGIVKDPTPTNSNDGDEVSVPFEMCAVPKPITTVKIGGYTPEQIVKILKTADKVVGKACIGCVTDTGCDKCDVTKLKELLGDR